MIWLLQSLLFCGRQVYGYCSSCNDQVDQARSSIAVANELAFQISKQSKDLREPWPRWCYSYFQWPRAQENPAAFGAVRELFLATATSVPNSSCPACNHLPRAAYGKWHHSIHSCISPLIADSSLPWPLFANRRFFSELGKGTRDKYSYTGDLQNLLFLIYLFRIIKRCRLVRAGCSLENLKAFFWSFTCWIFSRF